MNLKAFYLALLHFLIPLKLILGQTNNVSSIFIEDTNYLSFYHPNLINLSEKTWAFVHSYQAPLTESSMSVILVSETSQGLNNQTTILSENEFNIKSAALIQEWSDTEKIVGIGSAMFLVDSTYQLFLFEIENGQIEWTAIDSTQSSEIVDVSQFIVLNNNIHVIYAQQEVDSTGSYYLRHYYKISQSGELKFKSLKIDGTYISAITHFKNGQIIISGLFDEIHVIDTFNSAQTLFYSYEKDDQSEPLQMFLFTEKIKKLNNSLFLGARGITDRDLPNQMYDDEGLLMKINLNDSTYDYRSFGGVDTINNELLYSRDDCRLRSFDFQTDETLFQVTTLNSYAAIWFEESSNSLLVTHLDTNFNTIWQTEYTPEDSMRILCLEVKAQPDGGVVLINQVRNWKYKPENGYDLQFLRFNNKGELMGESILPNQSSDLSIYPNPSNGVFNLASSQSIDKIEIFNLQGRKVFEVEKQTQINLSALPSNTYLARVWLENDKVETKKLVLMR